MNSEIKAIILDLGNYASNDKPQRDEHNVIIPYLLHYIDANLLFDYICELEEENKKLKETNKNLIFLKDNYSKSINKAIDYIKKHKCTNPSLSSLLVDSEIKELENILKGSEE